MQVTEKPVPLKPCGHRLSEKDFSIIRKWSRVWKCKEAAALRRIINNFKD